MISVSEEIDALQSDELAVEEVTSLPFQEEGGEWLQERLEGLNNSITLPHTTDSDENERRELEAIFRDVLDEIFVEQAEAAKGGKEVAQRAETPVESAASIEEVYMEDVGKRLRELIPKPSAAGIKNGTHAPTPEFDADLYEQLKPLFIAILNHIQKQAT